MAELTYRGPGFFEREIDISGRISPPVGVPAAIAATAERGPAFVPVVVGSFADFETRFGTLDPERFGPYAVNEFLKTQTACTFMRVLGCGANQTQANINTTQTQGTVKNAGFVISGSNSFTLAGGDSSGLAEWHPRGCVQFIAARHYVSTSFHGGGGEPTAYPIFTDNDSFPSLGDGDDRVNLIHAMLFTASGTTFQILDYNDTYHPREVPRPGAASTWPGKTVATVTDSATGGGGGMPAFTFKLVLSNSDGVNFGGADGQSGLKIFTASLDPQSSFYIANFLNTDPLKFQQEKHLLYADFPVDTRLAPISVASGSVALLSGSENVSLDSGDKTQQFLKAYGRFDARYATPKTTYFISQPFGTQEHDLFYFETISDGAFANDKFKISIANIKPSSNNEYQYGTFEVQLRDFDDTDQQRKIIERFPNCNLDPHSDRYVGRIIGDKKVFFSWDASREEERRLVIEGKYPNRSAYIRIRIHRTVEDGTIPVNAVPFGFRGIPVLKTTNSLTDTFGYTLYDGGVALGEVSGSSPRLTTTTGSLKVSDTTPHPIAIRASIIPPLPYRFKVTRGEANTSPNFIGQKGTDERADSNFYWGVQNTMLPLSTSQSPDNSFTNAIYRSNEGSTFNRSVRSYTRFLGIEKLDTLLTGTGADAFNNNKFTLANVAIAANMTTAGNITAVTQSASDAMKSAVYIRNARLAAGSYVVKKPADTTYFGNGRITLATLLASSSVHYNRFLDYAKFTNIFYGGFDGLNILDNDMNAMNDRATSQVSPRGKASTGFTDTCLGTQTNGTTNPAGTTKNNSIVRAYRQAGSILANPRVSNANILVIPGIRDPLVSDHIGTEVQDNGQMFYVMDLEPYDENTNRIYANDDKKPDVRETAEKFEGRNVNNNYLGTYFPDVWIKDNVNNTVSNVPASIAALSALGFNDRNAKPWFAPAGFARGSLDFVTNVDVRLSAADRDTLYDARINPIATFPNVGFVIFGQKNLQLAQSALDRINVRRMLIEVKRLIFRVARGILFDQNTGVTRSKFMAQAVPLLALVQAQQGIEQFQIIMDDTNNTTADYDNYRLNGRLVIVPTRAIEYIAIDFIITQTGVSFE